MTKLDCFSVMYTKLFHTYIYLNKFNEAVSEYYILILYMFTIHNTFMNLFRGFER